VVTGGRAAVVVGVVVIAAIAVVGLRSSGSRVADPPTARPPPSAPKLLAAPGFGAGLGEWRAFPGTYLIKGQLGDPSALFARFQRDPTVAAAKDPATRSTTTGLATRVVTAATGRTQLRATVPVRGTRPGITVIVRLSERIGDRRVDQSERRAKLPDTGWHEVEAAHRVLRTGSSVHLEIWALALPRDQAIYVGQAKVTSA